MNDRFRHERDRLGEFGRPWREDRPEWQRERGGSDERRWRAQAMEPRYSSDYDETYGSEWERGRNEGGGFRQEYPSGYQQSRPGWYGRGHAGAYGGGSGGGYVGGHGGSGYGGSTGTDYGRGGYGGYAGDQPYSGNLSGDEGRFGGGHGGYVAGNQRGYEGSSRSGGGFAGRGPKGYARNDQRIHEDVCDRLSMDDDVDASEIEVRVEKGEVTLEGSVQTRSMKRKAEDIAEEVLGVTDVHNHLRVIKGMLNELKDKVTGKDDQAHYANSGTKDAPATGSSGRVGANGRL